MNQLMSRDLSEERVKSFLNVRLEEIQKGLQRIENLRTKNVFGGVNFDQQEADLKAYWYEIERLFL